MSQQDRSNHEQISSWWGIFIFFAFGILFILMQDLFFFIVWLIFTFLWSIVGPYIASKYITEVIFKSFRNLRKFNRKIHYFFIVMTLTLGTIMFSLGIQNAHMAIKSSQWPFTEGTVIKSQLTEKIVPVGYNGHEIKSEVTLKYRYSVQGISFYGSRIAWNFSDKNLDSLYSKKYPNGKSVKVFYNPKQPKESVLERKLWYGVFKGIVYGGTVMLGATLSLAFISPQKSLKTAATQNLY